MSSKTRSGLVSYDGDSEISDSEDERVSVSTSPPTIQNVVPTNILGIPRSQPLVFSSPPSLPKPVVQAAPTTVLVDYGDEDPNDSKGDNSALLDDTFHLIPETIEAAEMNETQTLDSNKVAQNKDAIPVIEVTEDSPSEVPVFLNTRDINLPPDCAVKCSKSLQSKIISLLQKKVGSGVDLNSSLQQRKDLRNPSIYEKLVHFCNLDEFGTNYPEHLYNPKEWTEESFYDNLFKEQRKEYMKKEKAKVDRTTVEFVTGTKRPPVSNTASKLEPSKKPRRSKWDLGTSSGPESGGSRGGSPNVTRDRLPLLGTAPLGMQPRVLQTGAVGAQARAQASQLNKELSKAK